MRLSSTGLSSSLDPWTIQGKLFTSPRLRLRTGMLSLPKPVPEPSSESWAGAVPCSFMGLGPGTEAEA